MWRERKAPRRCALAAAAAAVALGAGANQAQAHDHGIPRVSLQAEARSHEARLQWADWWDERGASCAQIVGESFGRPFPAASRISARRRRASFRFRTASRPREVGVYDHRRVGSDGYPRGGGRIATRTRRWWRGGEAIGWRVIFAVRGERHHYLWISAEFADAGGCPAQSGAWTGHLRGVR